MPSTVKVLSGKVCTVASKRIFRALSGHCGVRLVARQVAELVTRVFMSIESGFAELTF